MTRKGKYYNAPVYHSDIGSSEELNRNLIIKQFLSYRTVSRIGAQRASKKPYAIDIHLTWAAARGKSPYTKRRITQPFSVERPIGVAKIKLYKDCRLSLTVTLISGTCAR